jgi:hypothetical protein
MFALNLWNLVRKLIFICWVRHFRFVIGIQDMIVICFNILLLLDEQWIWNSWQLRRNESRSSFEIASRNTFGNNNTPYSRPR